MKGVRFNIHITIYFYIINYIYFINPHREINYFIIPEIVIYLFVCFYLNPGCIIKSIISPY